MNNRSSERCINGRLGSLHGLPGILSATFFGRLLSIVESFLCFPRLVPQRRKIGRTPSVSNTRGISCITLSTAAA
jgi:hypothetical protein